MSHAVQSLARACALVLITCTLLCLPGSEEQSSSIGGGNEQKQTLNRGSKSHSGNPIKHSAQKKKPHAQRSSARNHRASLPTLPKTLNQNQVARVVRQAGFPAQVIPIMVCTAKYESSFNTAAKNKNRNGSVDTGLFQINDIWLNACQVSRKTLLDPKENARCAYRVWKQQGLEAWYAFKKKEVECRTFSLAAKRMPNRI